MKYHILHVPFADPERDAIVRGYLGSGVDVCVHEDRYRRGIMPNFLTALEHIVEDDEQWGVILQDDNVGLGDWDAHVRAATFHSPAGVLCMTHFGMITATALARGIPYLLGPHLVWGGAVAFRRDFAGELLPWAQKIYAETGYPHDDRLVSAFANKLGIGTALTSRAIFDQPVEKSLVGHGGGNRRPSRTVESHTGPSYGAVPRYALRSSGAAKDQRDWLRTYGTEQEDPDWTFKVIRNGAVQRVRKETADA